MNVGSLFSGIGGIDLGLEQAGHHVVFQCEQDEWCRSVLAERFPGVPCYPDVARMGRLQPDGHGGDQSDVDGGEWVGYPEGSVHLLCGGFPCQDLSVAGRRAGLEGGERSSLFFEFARVADALLKPGGWLLIENVPGLLSSNQGRDFAVLLATLAELGFHDLAWRVLDSRYFGVAQRRRRVFIVARRARGRSACEVLLEPESSSRDLAASGEAGTRVASTLGRGLGSRGTVDAESAAGGHLVTNALDTMNGGADDNSAQANHLVTARTLTSSNQRIDGETETFVPVGITENQRGEVWETQHVNTLSQAGGKPGQGYAAARTAQGVRRLTPTECERLQGFPDGWTAMGADGRRYAALGNAVTVPVARWIGERIRSVEPPSEEVAK